MNSPLNFLNPEIRVIITEVRYIAADIEHIAKHGRMREANQITRVLQVVFMGRFKNKQGIKDSVAIVDQYYTAQ